MSQKVSTYLFSLLLLSGCNSPYKPDQQPAERKFSLYASSFETDKELVGFSGFGIRRISSNAAPYGGQSALLISGGCAVPHSSITLPPLKKSGKFSLEIWGKNLARGGQIRLKILNQPQPERTIFVSDSNWTFYTTSPPLPANAGDRLQIELTAGGLVYSAMLVDRLRIRQVE